MMTAGYDRNGLELSPMAETMNAYKMTTVDRLTKKFTAYARGDQTGDIVSIFEIGEFKDPRDAAFVGQEFAKVYTKEQVRLMREAGTFREVANTFKANIDIPVWKYPAEGLTMEEILGDYGYKTNRVEDARAAVVEALKLFNKKAPPLAFAKMVVAEVEARYKAGQSYRQAAKEVVQTLP